MDCSWFWPSIKLLVVTIHRAPCIVLTKPQRKLGERVKLYAVPGLSAKRKHSICKLILLIGNPHK